jgi:tetratricopeptide (TPR) repeat protein
MAKRARPQAGRANHKTRRPDGHPAKRITSAPVPVSKSKPAAPSAIVAPDAGALALFQRGLEALHRHAYKAALESFRTLLERFPTERAVLERTRVYAELCQRELSRRPADPRTMEERLTAATAALNNSEDALAEKLARSVLAEDSRQDLALYLLAAVEARRGAADAALSYLTQAVTASPEVRAQARHDADFESLRGSEAFQALIESPSAPSASRRGRRGR